MYLQAWRKYLPVIVILIKRSAETPQTLSMDANDFIKSSGGKKLKLGFTGLRLQKARISANPAQSEIAKDLAALLQESPAIRNILLTRDVRFAMSNDCTLSIEEVLVAAE